MPCTKPTCPATTVSSLPGKQSAATRNIASTCAAPPAHEHACAPPAAPRNPSQGAARLAPVRVPPMEDAERRPLPSGFRPSRGPPPPVSPENEFPHHPLCFPQLTMISCARECQQRKASAVTTSASSASTLPPEGTAATRRRSLLPSQEVPVRALHVPRSARAVAALPSDLGEIPMPRAFRFAASGHFPWSVDRSRVE